MTSHKKQDRGGWGDSTKETKEGRRGTAQEDMGRNGMWKIMVKVLNLSVFILGFHTVRYAILDWCFYFDIRSSSTGTKSAKLNGSYHHPNLARDFQERKQNSHNDIIIPCVDSQPGIQTDGLNRQTDIHHHTDLPTCKSGIHP